MKGFSLIFLLFIIFNNYAFSQRDCIKCDSIFISNFINIYGKYGVDSSLNFIYSTNKWVLQEHQAELQDIKEQLNGLVLNLGNYYGSVIIKKINLKDRYVGYSILMRYERQPLRFILNLYKPDNLWQLQSFQYDSNVGDEIKNSMNLSWEF